MPKEAFTEEQEQLARFARAMGHPVRISILQMLAKQTHCNHGDMSEVLPVAKSTLSQHLKELKDAGIIIQGKENSTTLKYRINPNNWKLVQSLFKGLLWTVAIIIGIFLLPVSKETFTTAIVAVFDLAKWYAQEHVILFLLQVFFIIGAISVFINRGLVLKYFGANAKKWLSYSFAAITGGVLAVCSCTVLPLFSSIYKRGVGLGPAVVFLYSGSAISVLSVILTWRYLGFEMGIARMVGAISFAIIIGLTMAYIFRKEEKAKKEEPAMSDKRPIWQTSHHFFALLAIGILSTGFLFVSTHGSTCFVPNYWTELAFGGNSLLSNFVSSIIGALMYFVTLTEVPIIQGLMASGMTKGPALALLLSGPALSLPSILVIRSVLGTQKMLVYVALVIFTATIAGFLFGTFF